MVASYLLTSKNKRNGIITCLRVLYNISNVSPFVKHMCGRLQPTKYSVVCEGIKDETALMIRKRLTALFLLWIQMLE